MNPDAMTMDCPWKIEKLMIQKNDEQTKKKFCGKNNFLNCQKKLVSKIVLVWVNQILTLALVLWKLFLKITENLLPFKFYQRYCPQLSSFLKKSIATILFFLLIQGSHDRSAWTIWGILCDCETSGTIVNILLVTYYTPGRSRRHFLVWIQDRSKKNAVRNTFKGYPFHIIVVVMLPELKLDISHPI